MLDLFQLQTPHREYASEGGIRRQYGLFGALHKRDAYRWRWYVRFEHRRGSNNGNSFVADLMNNIFLREVLYMVVVAGNFLNAGGYAGNAMGVKLSSLQKLTDIRANKPGMNLIHFVALQAEKKNHELLTFPEKLTTLENASK